MVEGGERGIFWGWGIFEGCGMVGGGEGGLVYFLSFKKIYQSFIERGVEVRLGG